MKGHDRLYLYDNVYKDGQMQLDIGEIVQVTELSLAKNEEVKRHVQICDEITYVISGEGQIEADGETEHIEKGQIHFIKKSGVHHIAQDGSGLRFLCLGFLPNYKNEINRLFLKELGERTHFVIDDDGTVKRLAELLLREFYSWDEHSRDAINRYITQIITAIYRILHKSGDASGKGTNKNILNRVMHILLWYIDREYISLKTVKEVADEMNYSEDYIARVFKANMGITIKEYLMRKKMSYASELLKTTPLSIESISAELSFSSPHTFRRAFKQYMGCSPGEFKRLNVKQKEEKNNTLSG